MPMHNGAHFRDHLDGDRIDRGEAMSGGSDDLKMARENRDKLLGAIDDQIDRLMNSDLPDSKKDELLTELKKRRDDLEDSPFVNANFYNDAVDAYEAADRALKNADSGSSSSSSGNSAATPASGGQPETPTFQKVQPDVQTPSPIGDSEDTPPTTEVDGTDVYEGNVEEFKELKSQLSDLEAKKESIEGDSSLSEGKKEEMLDQLDAAIRQVERGLDMATASATYDTTAGSTIDDADQSAINQAIAAGNDTMRDVNLRMDLATRGAERPHGSCGTPPPPGDAGKAGDAGSADGASGSSGAEGTAGSGEAGSPDSPPSGATDGGGAELEGLGMSVDEGVKMMQNDPGKFMNKLRNSDLSPQEQQMVFQQMQQRMQSIQQMMQTMSSLAKSMHQTKMGIIRNM